MILTTTFRCSSRMAAHSERRAYILSLGMISKDDTISLVASDSVSFDRIPRDPTYDIKENVFRTIEV